mgnify:CR=1 FL=1
MYMNQQRQGAAAEQQRSQNINSQNLNAANGQNSNF